MPRPYLLSPSQRKMILALPQAHETRLLARFYTFSDHDLTLIRQQRGEINRLGYAVVLAYLRYPGTRWTPDVDLPDYLLNYIAEQLDILPDRLQSYGHAREKTRREHIRRIQEQFGYQSFSSDQYPIHDWLLPFALSTGNGYALVEEAIRQLRYHRIILPALSTIETLCWQIHQSAQDQIFNTLSGNLSNIQKSQLRSILDKRDEDSSLTTLGWLRQPPGTASTKNFLVIIEQLQMIEAIDLHPQLRQSIHPNRLMELYEDGKRFSAWRLGRFVDDRRTFSTLVAYLLEQHMHLTDQALLIHTKLIQQALRRSANKQGRKFQQDGKAINRKLLQYVAVGKALINAQAQQIDPYQALQAVIPWDDFIKSIAEAEALTRPPIFDELDELVEHYRSIRPYSRALWHSFQFDGDETTEALRHAIELLRDLDLQEITDVPDTAPLTFINTAWQRLVLKDQDKIDRMYYELCTLKHLADRLRAGDIQVASSKRYRSIEDYLIPEKRWQEMKVSDYIPVAVKTDFDRYISERKNLLHERLTLIDQLLSDDAIPDASLKDGKLRFKNSKDKEPADQDAVTRLIYSRLPFVKITDLLFEVDQLTQFSLQFTHIQTGEQLSGDDRIALLTIILADALNMGLVKMAEACPDITESRLFRVADWHVHDENYLPALAEIINRHQRLDFTRHWGSGNSSSSDGQFFPTGGTRSSLTSINPHYSKEPGIKLYTHVSDRFDPFFINTISATTGEAPHVIDGLLYHQVDLDLHEHYTDTAGYSEHIFAMCHFLGFRFAPRIRKFNKKRLYTFDKSTSYPTLQPLIAGRLHEKLMAEYWDFTLRFVSSVRDGTATASLLLSKLARYPRMNQFAKAFREFGRLESTLFALDWIQHSLQRQIVNRGLLKGESHNSLKRAIFIHRLGKFRDRSEEDMRYRASGLNLVTAAIVLWNTIHISHVVETLRHQGYNITDEHLKHLSPLGWGHIGLSGDYRWNLDRTSSLQQLVDS